jgi:putative glycosyltransferase (TIGR04372 family)
MKGFVLISLTIALESLKATSMKKRWQFLRKTIYASWLGRFYIPYVLVAQLLDSKIDTGEKISIKNYRRILALKLISLKIAHQFAPLHHEVNLQLTRHYFYWGKIRKAQVIYGQYLKTKKERALQLGLAPRSYCFLSEFFPLNIGGIGGLDYLIKRLVLDDYPNRVPTLLLDKRTKVSNACLLQYFSQYVNVIKEPAVVQSFKRIRDQVDTEDPTFIMLRGENEPYEILKEQHLTQKLWEDKTYEPLLKLGTSHQERGNSVLQNLGIPAGAWFATLHVRESGYKDASSKHDISRNADVTSYLLACQAIVERGGWVIRVGDASMKPLPAMQGMIDYAHSSLKTDWMDIFLFGACRFMLCSNSGPQKIVQCFGRPIIQANSPSCAQPECGHDLYIMKKYFYEATAQPIGFKELFSYPLGANGNANYLKYRGIIFENNSPEEIKELTLQMMELLDGVAQICPEVDALNSRLSNLSAKGRGYPIGGRAGSLWLLRNQATLL